MLSTLTYRCPCPPEIRQLAPLRESCHVARGCVPLPARAEFQWGVRLQKAASPAGQLAGAGSQKSIQPMSRRQKAGRRQVSCSVSADSFTSPKTGAVGEERFRESAAPGTYWGSPQLSPEMVTLLFNVGDDQVEVRAHVGENLLRAAERCGAMLPSEEFCYEGTCCHCEMEVEGGAPEVGYRANPIQEDLVRSCICAVPSRDGPIQVSVLSEDDAWAESVL